MMPGETKSSERTQRTSAFGHGSERILVSMRRPAYLVFFALTLPFADPSAAGRPGDLDPAFGNNGVVVTAPAFAAITPSVILHQPDGKLIAIAEIAENASSELFLVRYALDGTLDATFGAGGIVVPHMNSTVFAAALQTDGKILVAAQDSDLSMGGLNGPLQLIRFLPDGSIDSQFGNGGT